MKSHVGKLECYSFSLTHYFTSQNAALTYTLIFYFVYKVLPHSVHSTDGTQRTVFCNSPVLTALRVSQTLRGGITPYFALGFSYSTHHYHIQARHKSETPALLYHEWIPAIRLLCCNF